MPILLSNPPSSIRSIPLGKLDFAAAELVRERLDDETVERYRESIRNGETLPAVVAFFDGESIYCPDGRHRAAAHEAEGRTEILCEVREGSQDDVIAHALGANVDHGLRRSREDTRRAVALALSHPVYGQQSSREVGRLCRCDHKTVESIRRKQVP